jgi:ABC-type proline/glycine betaine transport system permease subunit
LLAIISHPLRIHWPLLANLLTPVIGCCAAAAAAAVCVQRPAEKTPPAVISLVFAGLTLAPLALLVLALPLLGANFKVGVGALRGRRGRVWVSGTAWRWAGLVCIGWELA